MSYKFYASYVIEVHPFNFPFLLNEDIIITCQDTPQIKALFLLIYPLYILQSDLPKA